MRILTSFVASFLLFGAVASGSEVRALLRPTNFAEKNYLDGVKPALEGGMHLSAENEWGCETSGAMCSASWIATLNQEKPLPIEFSAESLFEGNSVTYVSNDYGLWLDVQYTDGSFEKTVAIRFNETSDSDKDQWESLSGQFVPSKPIYLVKFSCKFHWRIGSVRFRNPAIRQVEDAAADYYSFDGIAVKGSRDTSSNEDYLYSRPRFFIRDITADSDWVRMSDVGAKRFSASLSGAAPDFSLSWNSGTSKDGVISEGITITSLPDKERCATLVMAIPTRKKMTRSFDGLDSVSDIQDNTEICHALGSKAGMGRLSNLPLQGAGSDDEEIWLGLDPSTPAVFRTFYNAATQELCLAFDLGFVPGNNSWHIKTIRFTTEPGAGMRGAWQKYMDAFPWAFKADAPVFGLWMPFSDISKVRGYEDFGFAFKEGDMETAWDDRHGILTFHYSEPTTWWMNMTVPKKLKAKFTEKQLVEKMGTAEAMSKASLGDGFALAWEKSVMYGPDQKPFGYYRETPWSIGIVWSMSELPGIAEKYGYESSSFGFKWNFDHKTAHYPISTTDRITVPGSGIDGEYIDSAEGYITTELDFRKDHLALAKTPLTFSLIEKQPAVFTGLTIFEYVRGIAKTVHAAGKLTMANSTPDKFFWLAPMIDIPGTETNWHWGGQWRPMSNDEMQYRRMMSAGKPYCFLQNTGFSEFTPEMVEKYMMKSVAFGFFPGFFSGDAYTGRYFENPELYERDRPLFKKYIPVCKALAEAGWQCVTGVSLSDKRLLVERFGDGASYYITVFNPTEEKIELQIDSFAPGLEGASEIILGAKIIEPENTTVIKIKTH